MDNCMMISDEIVEWVKKSQGTFFNDISHVGIDRIISDLLSFQKPFQQYDILSKYTCVKDRKILEIGSGLGINLLVWMKAFNVDGYGIEPAAVGFGSSYEISKKMFHLNDVDPERIVNAVGENMPFEDNSFDIVYSSNVLEHVQSPFNVLDEAIRVVRPGGIIQIVYPNYMSYYDGHYSVFHPPILWEGLFPWYVQHIWRRDPSFAKTLNTELNYFWTKNTLEMLRKKHEFSVLSLGEDVFYERMCSFDFEAKGGLAKVKRVVKLSGKLKLNKIIAKMILLSKGWAPIILTMEKS